MERKIIEDLTSVVNKLTSVAEDIERKYERRDEEVLVSGVEAARLLGRSENAVSRMVKDGRLHRVTLGASTGIRLSEVLARR